MQSVPWQSTFAQDLSSQFGDRILACSTYLGQNFVEVRPDAVLQVLTYLKAREDFDAIVDITVVDYPKCGVRFDLIYIVYSYPRIERLRIKIAILDGYEPESVVPIWS